MIIISRKDAIKLLAKCDNYVSSDTGYGSLYNGPYLIIDNKYLYLGKLWV